MAQIINEKLEKCCNKCNKYMDKPCAWLSLGNEYCTEIMEVNEEIETLNNLVQDKEYFKKLDERIGKANNHIKRQQQEIERLTISLQAQEELTMIWYNKVKKIRDYIKEWQKFPHTNGSTHKELKNLMEIIDCAESDKNG